MKKINMLIVITASCFIAGCNAGKQMTLFQELQKAPEVVNEKTGDAKFDNAIANVNGLLQSTQSLLDQYYQATGQSDALAKFVNEFKKAKEENKDVSIQKTYDTLEAAIKDNDKKNNTNDWTAIEKSKKALKELNPQQMVNSILALATKAKTAQRSAKDLSSGLKGFDATTLKKLSIAKDTLARADYSMKALSFLKAQYNTVMELDKLK